MDFDLIKKLLLPASSKIVLLIMDGLGGLPVEPGGRTALEAAHTPNLDRLAAEGICGLHTPVGPGITPGSGPSHLAVFGYDPFKYKVGRGVLAALGLNFNLQAQDVAARGNFCTVDREGRVVDRRAGRIATELNQELLALLREIEIPGVEIFLEVVKDYRFVMVLRGNGLSERLQDTDPQRTGVPPLQPRPLVPQAEKTAEIVMEFIAQAEQRLAGRQPANMVLLRGFAQRPNWPLYPEVFGLRAAAITVYPMYRGVARLVGMEPLTGSEQSPKEEWLNAQMDRLEDAWEDYDFFFFHVKGTDMAGEDGDFAAKVAEIEAVDLIIPRLMALRPEVVLVTGDHSTPVSMMQHSWHPVPALLWSPTARPDGVQQFGERACLTGALGPHLPATQLMPLALAHAGRLQKYGA